MPPARKMWQRVRSAQVAAAPADRVAGLLETLVTLGQTRGTAEGRLVGSQGLFSRKK